MTGPTQRLRKRKIVRFRPTLAVVEFIHQQDLHTSRPSGMVSLVLHAFAASGSGCAGRPRVPAAAHTNTEYSIHQIDALRNEKHPPAALRRAPGRPRRAVFVPGQRGFCGVASFCGIRPKGPPFASFWGIFDLFITLCIFSLCFYGVNPTCRDVPHRHALAKSRGSFCENAQK